MRDRDGSLWIGDEFGDRRGSGPVFRFPFTTIEDVAVPRSPHPDPRVLP
ncbi:hypothetical protein GCM10020358_02190 [Amorphoplanes nipponensis]|uniref:Uncharacterized protein n=1 Tax=Actinoplanes nipponensis TaxID=135950 RepID=A0A919JFG5_9ACTN|nr:hypothetical protein [Actinoplanes nipponensis]GIE48370.1 hypothetical protein Ani05nite_19040 [Actinoplanes nipponensis]